MIFQETQNGKNDCIADEIVWRMFRAENGGKATVAVKRRHLGLLRHTRVILKWAMVVFGIHDVLGIIFTEYLGW